MSNATIGVIRDDIEKAVRNSSSKCAVARAAMRTFPDATAISVDIQTIRMTRKGKRYVYLTPRKVQDHIVAFDAGDNDIPEFTFRLFNPQITVSKNPGKTTLAPTPGVSRGYTSTTPVRTGGKTPPKARNYRSFGMRRMRINQQTPDA